MKAATHKIKELSMMTQPIQMFENLTSETSPAGGNVAKTGFSHDDRRLLEMRARYARSQMLADIITDALLWMGRLYQRSTASLRADFRLRHAEAQLYRMGDRELADLGLCRADIPFAVREAAAAEGVTPQFDAHAGTIAPANQNNSPAIFWAGRA
jgi:uncharacterized protein YjiS (DUF1127 family)